MTLADDFLAAYAGQSISDCAHFAEVDTQCHMELEPVCSVWFTEVLGPDASGPAISSLKTAMGDAPFLPFTANKIFTSSCPDYVTAVLTSSPISGGGDWNGWHVEYGKTSAGGGAILKYIDKWAERMDHYADLCKIGDVPEIRDMMAAALECDPSDIDDCYIGYLYALDGVFRIVFDDGSVLTHDLVNLKNEW